MDIDHFKMMFHYLSNLGIQIMFTTIFSLIQISHSHLGGSIAMGVPNSRMIYFMENPSINGWWLGVPSFMSIKSAWLMHPNFLVKSRKKVLPRILFWQANIHDFMRSTSIKNMQWTHQSVGSLVRKITWVTWAIKNISISLHPISF